MSLRDAIDAGRDVIRNSAEKLIQFHKIDELIKNAVILGQNKISVSFSKTSNMHVIQQEVVRQIREEGFEVEWVKSCCPNTEVVLHSTRRDGFKEIQTFKCKHCVHVTWSERNPTNIYGNITISWELPSNDHEMNDFNKG